MATNHDLLSLRASGPAYGQPLLLDGHSERVMTVEQLRLGAQWFARILTVAPENVRPRIVLVVRDRFRAAQWTLLALLNECLINPLNPESSELQLQAQMDKTAPHVVISDDGGLGWDAGPVTTLAASLLDSVLAPSDWGQRGSLAVRGDLLLYTSGTTSNPKGVLMRAAALSANVATAVGAFGYERAWTTAS